MSILPELDTVSSPRSRSDRSLYDELVDRGVNRRDFLKFCAWMSAYLGLAHTGAAQVARAIETKKRLPCVWLHFQECTCCTASFIRSSHPIVSNIILDKISLDYSETLMAAAGDRAKEMLHRTIKEHAGNYVLMCEGSIPTGANGVYCCIAGKTALESFKEVAAGAKAIIAWGNCATAGCVQAAAPNPTGATPIHKLVSGKPVINVPGCPPIAEVMAGVVVHLLTFDRLPQLDALGRPKAFFSRRIHDTCYRRPFYDAGLFVETFDDEAAKRGYCLYRVGCRGPTTYAACGVTKWNAGTSFPIQAGHPCIGCTEEAFWDNGPFYQRLAGVPGFGIESTADDIGLAVTGAVVLGAAAHTVLTTIRKKQSIGEQPGETEVEETPKH